MLVMLLVLRGLLGDAMAMSVVPVAASTVAHAGDGCAAAHVSHAGHRSETGPERHSGGHVGHGGHSDEGASEHDATHANAVADIAECLTDSTVSASSGCGDAHGTGCSTCGICHSALFTPDLCAPTAQSQPTALLPRGDAHFDSAAAAPVHKPPIS